MGVMRYCGMLIRAPQMAALQQYAHESLFEQAIAFLKTELAEDIAGWSDELLEQRVRSTMQRAHDVGIEDGIALQTYLAITFGVGPRFDRHPVVNQILRDPAQTPDARMAAILDDLSDRTWEEMSILTGAEDWDNTRNAVENS